MLLTRILDPGRSAGWVALDRFAGRRQLSHLLWICQLLSPFASRDDILRGAPQPIDWQTAVSVAATHAFLQSIHPCLEEHDLRRLAPADALEALREFHVQTIARRQEAAGQIERISVALNEIGIEPLWLKGAALVIADSRWSARRWMSDLDFHVSPDRLENAVGALRRMGYHEDPRQPHASEHHIRPLFHRDESLSVEVHFALAASKVAAMLPLERVLRRGRRIRWRGAEVLIPALSDQAVHIASQARPSAARFLHGRLPPRRICEFAQLAADLGVESAVRELRSACAEANQPEFAEEFLALAAELFGLPGDFRSKGAMEGLAFKVRFPRLHSLYFGFQGLSTRPLAYHLAHPLEFSRKLAVHVRRSMNPNW